MGATRDRSGPPVFLSRSQRLVATPDRVWRRSSPIDVLPLGVILANLCVRKAHFAHQHLQIFRHPSQILHIPLGAPPMWNSLCCCSKWVDGTWSGRPGRIVAVRRLGLERMAVDGNSVGSPGALLFPRAEPRTLKPGL